jgi:ComF family protein
MGLEGARAYALYDDHLRKVVLAFKYKGLRVLAASLGELMARSWPTLAPSDRGIDVVVPVPLHRARERARGFNQAALLSRHLAAWIRRPVVEDALLRTKPTSPQVGLSPEERRKNVDGAFQCITGSLAGQRVLLVDDVYTTGSTLEAARAALHGAGVRSVWAYTLARADSPPSS